MRRFLPVLLLIVSLMLDTSVVTQFWIARYAPLFTLMSVVVFGLLLGRTRGSMYGMIAGLLMDISIGQMLGLYTAQFLICGYLSGLAGRRYQRYVLTPVVMPLICFSLYELAMTITRYLSNGFFDTQTLRDGLIRVPVAVVMTQIIYLLYNRIFRPTWSRYAGR